MKQTSEGARKRGGVNIEYGSRLEVRVSDDVRLHVDEFTLSHGSAQLIREIAVSAARLFGAPKHSVGSHGPHHVVLLGVDILHTGPV